MPNLSSTGPNKPNGKGKADANQLALLIVVQAALQIEKPTSPEKNPSAISLGRLGGIVLGASQ